MKERASNVTKQAKSDERTQSEKEADKALAKKFTSGHAWQVAEELGLEYDGDSNAIVHGGYFYNPHDWVRWGYAECVEVYRLYDDLQDTVYFSRGTIHRIENVPSPEERIDPNNIDEEIQACRQYAGIETDEYEGDETTPRRFNLKHWKHEWRMWLQVLPMLRRLAKCHESF